MEPYLFTKINRKLSLSNDVEFLSCQHRKINLRGVCVCVCVCSVFSAIYYGGAVNSSSEFPPHLSIKIARNIQT